MKCIVGLGNPGNRYRDTRHNIGFLALQFFIDKHHATLLEYTEGFVCYRTNIGQTDILFVMPQTYMNNSGEAVRELHERYEVALEDFLILYDDFQLPFGTLRMRPNGSDGGHNGIASVIELIHSDQIPRLRIGVGGSTMPVDHTHELMAGYVLENFNTNEKKLLPSLFLHAHDACVSWIQHGIQTTMSQYNRNFFSSANAE